MERKMMPIVNCIAKTYLENINMLYKFTYICCHVVASVTLLKLLVFL